jgi:hypothetical protein
MGRSLRYPNVAHNRLLVALAQGMGQDVQKFGNPDYCSEGALTGLV